MVRTAPLPTDNPGDLSGLNDRFHSGEFAGAVEGIVLVAGRLPPSGSRAELRGVAHTDELPTGADPENLQPARAVRRALADARMSAADIGYACASVPGDDAALGRAILDRGLGRFADAVTLEVGQDAVVRAVEAVASEDARVIGAVALIIRPGLGNIALAFGRP